MNSSLYIGATGMKGLAEGMNVTTNNLANVSTIGFKKQDMLFSDVISQTQASMGNWWNAQEDSRVAIGQVGMGLQIEAVRTSFTQGGLESTNVMTDLAINGKGFFQVTDGEKNFYTRAGDFRSDNEGVWRTPSGLALTGYQLDASGNRGDLAAVQIQEGSVLAAKATSTVSLTVNVQPGQDRSVSDTNPYFSLLSQYNGGDAQPLSSDAFVTSQAMTVYDAEGNGRTVTAYFDGAPANGSNSCVEFLIAADSVPAYDESGNPIQLTEGDNALMTGILEFDSTGKLINMSAFTPTVAGSKDLNNWTTASIENGIPAFSLAGTDIALDFGITSPSGWQGTVSNAAQIGTNSNLIPQMGEDVVLAEYPVTSFYTSDMVGSYKQDGYSEGMLSNMSISNDGIVTGYYSNGQSVDLWEIPVARFTSEDGLYREGGNLFTYTAEAGEMELGQPGTDNFGTVEAYNIETSNVDLAQEMVNMIINQRGFQSNSKVVTTADQMLQKAMELKRS